jgi:outer membrane protein assembly factor BamB
LRQRRRAEHALYGELEEREPAEGEVKVSRLLLLSALATAATLAGAGSIGSARAMTRGAASATSSPLALNADTHTTWIYGLDSTIQRELTVTNTGPSGIFSYAVAQPTNPNGQFMGVCDPQPSFLYLASGSSTRIICSAAFAEAVPGSRDWQTGSTHQFPMQIAFAQVTGAGQASPLQTITLDNSVYVQQTQNGPPNAPMAKPNAGLAVSVVDGKSGQPIAGAGVLIENNEAGWTYHLDSHDGFTGGRGGVQVDAYERGVIPAWQPYALLAQAPGYADAHVGVSPVSGQTTTVRIAMHKPTLRGSYKLFGDYDAIDPVGRGAVSADGRFLATVPFGESPPPQSVIARSQLDFFDTQRGKLLWSKTLGVIAMPSIDVSADGRYVAMIDPGQSYIPNQGIDLYPTLTLLNRQGKVVWSIPALAARNATAAINGGPVTVKFSPDGRSLAYGTANGALFILDRATGAIRSQAFLGGQVRNLAWSANGSRIYASSGDNNVYALATTTGAVLWKTDVGGWALFWDVSAHEILLTAKTGYALTMLATANGSILWRQSVMNTDFGSVISPNEQLEAVANPTGNGISTGVYNRSGKLLWAVAASSNAVAFAGSKYVLFEQEQLGPQGATSGGGNSDSLDLYAARSGELVWSAKLPGPAGDWGHGEAGYLSISPDAETIVAGGAETGHVSFYRGTVKTLSH